MAKQSVILLVYGKGGHTEEAKRYMVAKENENISYVTLGPIAMSLDNEVRHYTCSDIRDRDSHWKNTYITLVYSAISIFHTFRILNKYSVKGFVSTGPGLSFIPALICKLFNKKIVYFESWCRTSKPSIAGLLMYNISDLFFIQHKSMAKYYAKGIFKGRL